METRNKYETAGSRLLSSSAALGWQGTISAELRRHEALHCPAFVQPVNEIAIAIGGMARIRRRADGAEQSFVSRAGSACVCPRGVQVKYLHIASGPLDMLHLYLPDDLYESLECTAGTPASAGLRYTGGFYDPLIQQIGLTLADTLRSEGTPQRLLVDSLGVALAARLMQRYTRAGATRASEGFRDAQRSAGLDPVRLRRVIDFMHQHLARDIALADLARVACLSVFHFARAFRQATGTAPIAYLTELRVSRARELLAGPATSIEAIAQATGFSSGAGLARAFRRNTGVSPTQYRRQATHG